MELWRMFHATNPQGSGLLYTLLILRMFLVMILEFRAVFAESA